MSLSKIRQLSEGSFEIPSELFRSPLRFRVESALEGTARGPRRGEEAYGVLVKCEYPKGHAPSFLKLFKTCPPRRLERTKFLVRLGLSGRHWMFQALPYYCLVNFEICGVPVFGYLARQVCEQSGQVAPSFRYLIETDWGWNLERRRRLAGQLCCAVHTLEGLNLVHGDLSLDNVLIGWDPRDGDVAVLCDFDSFYHPLQPLLPLEYDGKPVRPCGTDGFYYPELFEQIIEGDPAACVRTDRMALGALVCQIMVWTAATAEQLGRFELLDNSDIELGSLSRLPADLIAQWPLGFDLLAEALRANHLEAMPSPRRWLEVLGGPPILFPLLIIRNRERQNWEQAVCLRSTKGSLVNIDPELKSVTFYRSRGCIRLLIDDGRQAPLMVRHSPDALPQRVFPRQARLNVGGKIVSGSWHFEYACDLPRSDLRGEMM